MPFKHMCKLFNNRIVAVIADQQFLLASVNELGFDPVICAGKNLRRHEARTAYPTATVELHVILHAKGTRVVGHVIEQYFGFLLTKYTTHYQRLQIVIERKKTADSTR